VIVESQTYLQIGKIHEVMENQVQGWYLLTWRVNGYEFVPEQLTFAGRADFVFEGMLNTHVVEFGMVPVLGNTSITDSTPEYLLKRKREIDAVLKKKTAQVRKYVPPPKHEKPLRWWVALFSRCRGELIQVTEVFEV
jgi:hypothetical protein